MKALLIVDVQNDFLPVGTLGVEDGDAIIPAINALQKKFDLVVATQDWHPADHSSFAATQGKEVGEVIDLDGLEQIMWPVHCVQGSRGAEFAPSLETDKIDRIFQKGCDVGIDSYSAFFDNARKKDTGLSRYLKEKGVADVYIVGLATDYCVKFSVLDAIDEGFGTAVVLDACRGVNLQDGDVEAAINEMRQKGANIVTADAVSGR